MIENLLSELFSTILSFLSSLFNTIFGGWSWQVLFSWLPSDILSAAEAFILVCFGLAVLRILKSLLPL